MKRSEQGGAIVGFLLASVVLALLLVGGVYAIHHHPGWLASTTSPSVSAPGSSHTDQSSDSQKPDVAKPGNDKNKSTASAPSSDGSSTDNGSGSTAPSTSGSDTTPTPTTGSTDNSAGAPSQSTSTLPQTGPADAVWSILGVGLVTVTAAAYVRSRRLV